MQRGTVIKPELEWLLGRGVGPLTRPDQFRKSLLVVLVVLIWASSWPIIKLGVSEIPPIWYGFLRYLIAVGILVPVLALFGHLRVPRRQDWSLVFVSGALQMGAYAACMGIALVTLPPGRASVLAYSTPIWVLPMAGWWLGERVTRRDWIAMAIGMLGMLAVASPSLIANNHVGMFAYAALVMASLVWAMSIVYVRGHTFHDSPLILAPWQMLVAGVLLLPCALVLEGPFPQLGTRSLASLAFVGPVSTAFAYWAVVEAGRHFRATTMSLALLATPVVGILISVVTLGERIDLPLVVGIVLVALAITLTALLPRDTEAAPRSPGER